MIVKVWTRNENEIFGNQEPEQIPGLGITKNEDYIIKEESKSLNEERTSTRSRNRS